MPALPPLSPVDLEHVLVHSEASFRALAGARVLVTGGTGFYGRWIIESLNYASDRLDVDIRAVILTRSAQTFLATAPHVGARGDVRFCEGDVRTFELPEGGFTHLLHFATPTTGVLGGLDLIDTIVLGTRHVLESAVAAGASRALLASSGAVYGAQPATLTHLAEDCGLGPLTSDPLAPYAEGKRLAEVIGNVVSASHGIGVTHARGFAFMGPHLPLDAHFAIGNFVRDAEAGREIVVKGDGTPYRSYLYGADLAVWLWTMLVRGGDGRAYNVGSPDGRPLGEVARAVAKASGVAVRVVGKPVTGARPSRYVPDVSRARDELGLEPRITLDEGVERWLAWLRARRA